MLGAASLPHLDVICQVDAPSIVGAGNWIGRSFGIHASAGGKLALAARSDAQAREMLGAGPLERYTARTIVTTDAFLSKLARVRDTSVAESVDELEHGLVTVAVPVGPLDAHEFAVGVAARPSGSGQSVAPRWCRPCAAAQRRSRATSPNAARLRSAARRATARSRRPAGRPRRSRRRRGAAPRVAHRRARRRASSSARNGC